MARISGTAAPGVQAQLAGRSARARRVAEDGVARLGAPARAAGAVRAPGNDDHGRLQEQIGSLQKELAAANQARESLESALAAEQETSRRLEDKRKAFYRHLVNRVVGVARDRLPQDAVVLVVSRGDDRLLALDRRRGWHFPQNKDGVYAGFHPADSAAAIAHLEELRAKGAKYLVIPDTSRWWLDYYEGFRQHLEQHEVVADQDGTCLVLSLNGTGAEIGPSAHGELAAAIESFEAAYQREPSVLDWSSGLELAGHLTRGTVFSPPTAGDGLPYVDGTVDIVVCGPSTEALREARRVAAAAIAVVRNGGAPAGRDAAPAAVEIEWMGTDPVVAAC